MRPAASPRPHPARRLLLAAALPLLLAGCVSLSFDVPPEPECAVGALAVVHGDPAGRNFEEPLSDEPVIAADPSVYSLIKVLQVSKPLTLQWLWYSPDNQLARRSKAVAINAKGKYLAYFAAWDVLANANYAEKKGRWTVVITANGSFLARKEFQVN